jgi:hypothetical protein
MAKTLGKRYRKIAYGKPKSLKKAGKLIDTGGTIGTRIVQYVYFRPSNIGFKAATGRNIGGRK